MSKITKSASLEMVIYVNKGIVGSPGPLQSGKQGFLWALPRLVVETMNSPVPRVRHIGYLKLRAGPGWWLGTVTCPVPSVLGAAVVLGFSLG